VLCALLENGGKIRNKVPRGAPALHLAAEGGYEDVVRRILEIEDVDVNAVGKTDYTPLLCVVRARKVAIVKVLLDAGADPDVRLPDGKTSSDLARENKDDKIMEILHGRSGTSNRGRTRTSGGRDVANDKNKELKDVQQLKIVALRRQKDDRKEESEILIRQAIQIYERVLGLANSKH
jgi:hypothetical protein